MARYLAAAICVYLMCVAATAQPRIIAPDEMLKTDALKISIDGLKPGTVYAVRTELASRAGTIWRSEAKFTSDDKGTIDLTKMAPDSGSYTGVDPMGIVWSMENSRERSTDGLIFDNDEYSALNVTVREGEKTIAQRYVMLRHRAVGVSTTELRGQITGTYFAPLVAKNERPGVIVLGGSEGGVSRPAAALLASHGYPTLALAYFGMGALPKDLERIPVETVSNGVDWLSKQQGVDENRIVVLGMSKGAELALVAASANSRIRGVIAIAPSSVVYGGIGQGPTTLSSWTLGGKDLPFAPYVRTDEYAKSRRLIDLYDPSFDKAPPEAAIEVEKIAGPILLLSGKNDLLWPSARMADKIAARLAAAKFRHALTNRQWDDAGHHVARVPFGPTADSVRLGGSTRSLSHSQIEGWRVILAFINDLAKKGK